MSVSCRKHRMGTADRQVVGASKIRCDYLTYERGGLFMRMPMSSMGLVTTSMRDCEGLGSNRYFRHTKRTDELRSCYEHRHCKMV